MTDSNELVIEAAKGDGGWEEKKLDDVKKSVDCDSYRFSRKDGKPLEKELRELLYVKGDGIKHIEVKLIEDEEEFKKLSKSDEN